MSRLDQIEGALIAVLAKLLEVRDEYTKASEAQAQRNRKLEELDLLTGDPTLIQSFSVLTAQIDKDADLAAKKLQRSEARLIELKQQWFAEQGKPHDPNLCFWSIGGKLYTGLRNEGVGSHRIRDRSRPA